MSAAVEWSSASCSKCAGHGTLAAREGFSVCDECRGLGKLTVQPSCCSAHDDVHHGGGGDEHGHGHHDDLPTTLVDLMVGAVQSNPRACGLTPEPTK
jgi:DnaJ-class molecular chaperone